MVNMGIKALPSLAGLVLLLLLTVGLSPSADSFQMQSTFSGFCATARDARLLCSPSLGSVALGSSVTNMGLRSSIRTTALCPDGDTVLRAGAADFVLESFDPEEEEDELSNENLLKILYSQTTDYYVNDVVWKALGYEKLPDGTYSNEKVFPKWREKHPQPPDVIGVQRNYTYSIDRPSQKANQALVASIPEDHKQGIKIKLRPHGFTGFKLEELTPNKTRRAQCVNWLLFYRDALRGKSIEQLQTEREQRAAAAAAAGATKVVSADTSQKRDVQGKIIDGAEQTNWRPPIREVL